MKKILFATTLTLWCGACNDTRSGTSFVMPTPTAPTVPNPNPQIPGVSLAQIQVGDVVNGAIVATDPLCGDVLGEIGRGPCQGFETVVPADGRLTVEVTSHSEHPVSLLVRYGDNERATGSDFSLSLRTPQVRASTPVLIGVWVNGSEAPVREPFQLTTTLTP